MNTTTLLYTNIRFIPNICKVYLKILFVFTSIYLQKYYLFLFEFIYKNTIVFYLNLFTKILFVFYLNLFTKILFVFYLNLFFI